MAVERTRSGVDGISSGDRITELSPVELLSELGNLNRQVARPEDPTDLRFNRTVTLNFATAAIHGKGIIIPGHVLNIYTALHNGVLEPGYLPSEANKKLGVPIDSARKAKRLMSYVGVNDPSREESSEASSHAEENSVGVSQREPKHTAVTPAEALLLRLYDVIRTTEPIDAAGVFRREAAGNLIEAAFLEGIFDAKPDNARAEYKSSLLQSTDGATSREVFEAMEYSQLGVGATYSVTELKSKLPDVFLNDGQLKDAMELLGMVGLVDRVVSNRLIYMLRDHNVVLRDGEPSSKKPKMTPGELVISIRETYGLHTAKEIASIANLPLGKVSEILEQHDNPPRHGTELDMNEGEAVILPRVDNGEIVERDGKRFLRVYEGGIPQLKRIS